MQVILGLSSVNNHNIMKYIYHEQCNFCKSKKKEVIYKIGKQNLVRCKGCGLAYLDMQRSDLEHLYNASYYYETSKNTKAHYTNYSIEEKVVRQNFDFAYEFIKKNKKTRKSTLLEIGAGFGYFLKYLPKEISSEAVEVSKEAAQIMQNAGLKVHKGDFLKKKIDKKFDFIVSFDVIEHQNYLDKYIGKINSLLKEGGFFIFTTPDFDTIYNKMLGRNAPLIRPLYHNYYLCKEWIGVNMQSFGLRVIFIKTIHTSRMNIGYILLETSFSFPIIRKIGLLKFAHMLKIDTIVIPFFRFGGIQCIVKKI